MSRTAVAVVVFTVDDDVTDNDLHNILANMLVQVEEAVVPDTDGIGEVEIATRDITSALRIAESIPRSTP